VDGYAVLPESKLFDDHGWPYASFTVDAIVYAGTQRIGHVRVLLDTATTPYFDGLLLVYNDPRGAAMNRDGYENWEYYEEGDVPITLLIPPDADFSTLHQDYRPVLLVHGLKGNYTKWQDIPSRLAPYGFDVWSLSYPYDQRIEDSAILLGRTLMLVPSGGGLTEEPFYLSPSVSLVTHSMGGLVTRSLLEQSEEPALRIPVKKVLMLGVSELLCNWLS